MPEIYTIGYGRDTKENFQKRLGVLERPVLVVDVRREGSLSRNGKWAYQGEGYMGETVRAVGYEYCCWKELANTFGNSKRGLLEYEAALRPSGDLRKPFIALKNLVAKGGCKFCLLCAERKPFVGKKPNCHRVILAERIAFELDVYSGAAIHWDTMHIA